LIKYSEIVKGIKDALEAQFPDVHMTSNDVKSGFKRPSIFISFVNPGSTPETTTMRKRTFTLRLSYFPSSRTKNMIELLDTQDSLEAVFSLSKTIKITESFSLHTSGCSFNTVDEVLHMSSNFECFELLAEEDAPLMNTFEITTKKEGE